MIVELSAEEGLAAAMQGALQIMRATRNGWVGHDHGGTSGRDLRERWAHAIHGQMCEQAVAKGYDHFPRASRNGIQLPDCLAGAAIRGTPWDDGHLIINESELPACNEVPFILVTGHWPVFTVRGWCFGAEAVRADWWRPWEKPPSWWMPQAHLHRLDTLPRKQGAA